MAMREVPLRTKLLYAVGDLAINLKNASINRFLLFFYVDVLMMAPAAVGAVLFVGKAWDAVTDPVMGYISDTTRSRWGRRRPYVLFGAVPMGLCFYLLFAPPLGITGNALFAYLLLLNLALFTCFTIFAVPYLAWGAELARGYHERTTVVQVRALLGIIGGVAGATLPVVIASRFVDQRAGYAAMAAVLGIAIALSGAITGLFVGERARERAAVPTWGHFLRGLSHTFANRDFRIVFVTFCLMTVSSSMGEAVQIIVVKYWLQMYDFFPLIGLTFGVSFAASFPLWLVISQRIGKSRALRLGLTLGSVVPFGWLIVQPGQRALMLLFMVIAGAVAGCLTLAVSQAADVVDLDELQTGEQRAGAYFGIWALGLKLANAVGIFLGGVLLEQVGYVADAPQDPATLWWLVILIGPLQGAVIFAGLLVFRRIKFDAADVAQVQAALAARNAGGASSADHV